MKSYLLFFTGLGAMALVIGILTGLSSSPVVATVVPLLFTLVTAGGVFLQRNREVEEKSFPVFTPKGHGLALIVFSTAFAFGIYGGVGAKLHWKHLWFGKTEPAFVDTEIEDFRILAAVLETDRRLIESGVSLEQRKTIFTKLFSSIAERESARRNAIKTKREAIGKIDEERFFELTSAFETLSANIDILYSNLDDFDEETYETFIESLQHAKEIAKVELIEEIEDLQYELSDADLEWEASSMLSEEELEALAPILPKASTASPRAEPFRAIASDEERLFPGYKDS